MIKQDYLIRMIQDFISRVAKAIMDRKKIRQQDWAEFDLLTQEVLGLPVKELTSMSVEELIDRYDKEEDRMSKIEFASMYLLKLSEEIEEDRVMKSKFRQDGMIQDDYRIDFVKGHLRELHRAIEDGANCKGYLIWTFIDCWSWLNSYKNRYGLVELDLETQERRLKKSGHWFKELSDNNGF